VASTVNEGSVRNKLGVQTLLRIRCRQTRMVPQEGFPIQGKTWCVPTRLGVDWPD